jgi:hypothetical protein
MVFGGKDPSYGHYKNLIASYLTIFQYRGFRAEYPRWFGEGFVLGRGSGRRALSTY